MFFSATREWFLKQRCDKGLATCLMHQHIYILLCLLPDWLSTLGLDPNAPVNVIGYFGQTRDLSIFERVQPRIEDDCTESSQGEESVACGDMTPSFVHKGSGESGHRLPVYVKSDQDTDEDEQEDTPSEKSTGMSLGIGDQRVISRTVKRWSFLSTLG